jgi:hypothetical protein
MAWGAAVGARGSDLHSQPESLATRIQDLGGRALYVIGGASSGPFSFIAAYTDSVGTR